MVCLQEVQSWGETLARPVLSKYRLIHNLSNPAGIILPPVLTSQLKYQRARPGETYVAVIFAATAILLAYFPDSRKPLDLFFSVLVNKSMGAFLWARRRGARYICMRMCTCSSTDCECCCFREGARCISLMHHICTSHMYMPLFAWHMRGPTRN